MVEKISPRVRIELSPSETGKVYDVYGKGVWERCMTCGKVAVVLQLQTFLLG